MKLVCNMLLYLCCPVISGGIYLFKQNMYQSLKMEKEKTKIRLWYLAYLQSNARTKYVASQRENIQSQK